jgi:hypothetical protein
MSLLLIIAMKLIVLIVAIKLIMQSVGRLSVVILSVAAPSQVRVELSVVTKSSSLPATLLHGQIQKIIFTSVSFFTSPDLNYW